MTNPMTTPNPAAGAVLKDGWLKRDTAKAAARVAEWTSNKERAMDVHEYVEGYEFRGDQDYTPNDHEKALIEDAIHGYLGLSAAPAPASVDAVAVKAISLFRAFAQGVASGEVARGLLTDKRAAAWVEECTAGFRDDLVKPAALSSTSAAEPVAANKAEAILRQVRRFIAAENLHAARGARGENTTRDDVDFEHSVLVDFTVADVDAALRIVRRRATHPAPAAVESAQGVKEGRLLEALDYLAENKSRSLAFDGKTFCEDDNSDLWIVTEVQGGLNDRELVLLGSGDTPAKALIDALPSSDIRGSLATEEG